MRRGKLPVFIILVSLLLIAVCIFLLATRSTLMPTGVPGDPVEFGMTVDEVRQSAGSPDRTYQDAFWYRHCVYYYEREILGHSVSVSYTFSDMEENPRARVTEAGVTFTFDAPEECDRVMEELRTHFRELMKEEPQFSEDTRQGPAHDWDPPDQLQTCTIASTRRIVRMVQYPDRIFLMAERKK